MKRMRWAMMMAVLALAGNNVKAQSSDAAYPMGVWQTVDDENSNDKYFVNLEMFREVNENGSCGSLDISDINTDKTLYYGELYYSHKELDNNNVGNGTYVFKVKSDKGKECTIRVNAKRQPMVTANGELKDHPALKQKLQLCPGALGGTGGEVFGMYCESEKELLGFLRSAAKLKNPKAPGFGNLQQFINAHANLDPSKPKFAKPKGTGAINVREKANTTAAKIGELKAGETLPVIDEFNGWCQVKLSEKQKGWVSLSVVTLTNVEGKSGMEMTYAPTVDGHVTLLGISLGLKPAEFSNQLMAKGFKKEWGDENNMSFTGTYHGTASRVSVSIGIVNGQKGCISGVHVISLKSLKLAQAKVRYREMVQKMEGIYGKGKTEASEQTYARHVIPVAKGYVSIEMMNEDEMDGASDFYVVNMYLSDQKD